MNRSLATCAALLASALAAPLPAVAQQTKEGGAIFTCTAASGRKLTADRPIAECLDREQRVLNKDGSLRMILPPSLTSDERAAQEEAERKKVQERTAKNDAIRRDRNLLARYPNEPVHQKAREAALDEVRSGIQASQKRLAELETERKPLVTELEFYKGKAPPAKLRNQIEAIDVSVEAQNQLIANQKVELQRVTALYDAELERLKKLWGGAQPGSLGPLPQSALAAASAPAAPTKKN